MVFSHAAPFLAARAFAFHVPSTGQRAVFLSADLGQVTLAVTSKVVEELSLIGLGCYTEENITLSATHTHCSPGGLSHYTLYNAHPPLRGFHPQYFGAVVKGIVKSIRMAHEASPTQSTTTLKN